MSKSGSKFFTGLIAFLLGFILGILAIVGSVAGVCVYVAKADLDSIFQTLGIQNKDNDGNYIYINTDPENGGAQNLGDLLSIVHGYLYSPDSSVMDYPVLGNSLSDINDLLPVTGKLLNEKLYPMIDKYVDVEWEEFEKISISEMPQFLSNTLMDVRPAPLLEKLGMNGLVGEDANVLVKSLLAGAEFSYAYTEDDCKFPVYYDTYVYNDGLSSYYREEGVNGQQAYPANLNDDLLYDTKTKNADGKNVYRLYYIPCTLNADGTLSDAPLNVAESQNKTREGTDEQERIIYGAGTTFIAVKYDADNNKYKLNSNYAQYAYYSDYGFHNIDRTGNFYYSNDDSEMQIYPVTLRSFSDPNEVFKPLYSTMVSELLGGKNGDNAVVNSMFGNVSVGELMDGKVNFDEAVNDLELAKVVNIDPEESLMAYIGYGLSNITKVAEGHYVGYAEIDGSSVECTITSELKGTPAKRAINKVVYKAQDENDIQIDKELHGTKVKEVASLTSGLEITAVMKVKTSDAILAYLGYGISGIEQSDTGRNYSHTATYKAEDGREFPCFITTDDESVITSVWYMDGEQRVTVGGTTISKLSGKVSSISNELCLKDVMNVTESDSILWSLRNSKICDLGKDVKGLKIKDVLDEKSINDSPILRQLSNKSIDDLSSAIDAISIQSIYAKEIYALSSDKEDPKEVTAYSSDILYYIEQDGVFTYVHDEDGVDQATEDNVGRLSEEEFNQGVANGVKYYSYGEAKGMWRLIIFKDNKEKAYTLNNFNNMINVCTSNINDAKLGTLQDAGIIDSNANLNGTLRWTDSGGVQQKQLKEMSLAELINAVIAISNAVSNP